MRRLSRRTFLQTATVATAATLGTKLHPASAQPTTQTEIAYPENGTLIPDDDWRLWIDEKAEWKNDPLFLPEDVSWQNGVLCGKGSPLPVNEPTGGWGTLAANAGINVTLPTTVEQHHWGEFGTRPYTPDEYRYAADDPIPQNGAYLGVSWWGRLLDIPAEWKGKRIFLHIRGARLRAEVFLNKKLVGYSIMEELPFECDLTNAADPGGLNLIAIRLTNPFGRYDWVDGLNAQWGAVKLYRSHGFAGLDRGMTLSAHPTDMQINGVRLLNTPDPRTISLAVGVESGRRFKPGNIESLAFSLSVTDARTGSELKEIKVLHTAHEQMGRAQEHLAKLTFPSAKLWDLETPNLYNLKITFETDDGQIDTRTISFGLRSFAPEGIGTNAVFRLNNRRIKLYSSISWGFWGLNGLFPTPELAEKEVTQAKKLNLNCLNFHRNLAKEEVLRAHDRLGLLRYMEPGAGKMAIGKLPASTAASANSIVMEKPTDDADKFAQRFMFVKCVEMVRAYRSHPSVIIYCLQNEIGADLKNPDTIAILAAMHAEDPSRCVVLNDGFVAPPRKAAQAWYEPWSAGDQTLDGFKPGKLHRSDEEEWGDWWNQHQGAGDQWYDEFYKSPADFTYKAPFKNVLTEFGEMEGCATPDNHSLMIHQITETYRMYGGTSYDLTDHKEILAAYDKFLDRWKFREAFPATEKLWLALGKKCYDTWQNYLENARISDDLDFAVISGWETTAIENHSGIVDNLRNFKSDPAPIAGALVPIRPVAKQRSASIARGDSATFDLYLLNDTPQPAAGTLAFTAVTPSGKLLNLGTFPAPVSVKDQFSYLLKEAFQTPPLTEEGLYRFKFSLSTAPLSTQTKEIWVTEPPAYKRARALNVAVSGITPALHKQLIDLGPRLGIQVEDFSPGKKYDVIASSGLTAHTSATQNAGDTTGLENQPGHETGAVQTTTQPGHIDPAVIEAVRAGTPLLAIPQADTLSDGVAKQLAAAGAFTYNGTVGDFRAPWMGNWYFVRQHPVYAGLPVNQVMGIHYQAKGRQSNGLLVDGINVEIIAAYSRDHDRNIGAGTFTTKLGSAKLLYHRVPELHPVLQQRFLANAIAWLSA
jgi:beta-galactosidase